jgi:ribonuclease E
VTSLGLVQMTRKRIGTGLLEAFSHECDHCHGRGLIIEDAPVEPKRGDDESGRRGRRRGRGAEQQNGSSGAKAAGPPSPKDVAAMAQHHPGHHAEPVDELVEVIEAVESVEVMEPAEVVETAAVDGVVEAEAVDDQTPDEPAEPEDPADAAPPAPPAPPKVVTRSRRRAATRPAGPPVAVPESDSEGAVLLDVADDSHDHHDTGPALHVPIKRRGSRKR